MLRLLQKGGVKTFSPLFAFRTHGTSGIGWWWPVWMRHYSRSRDRDFDTVYKSLQSSLSVTHHHRLWGLRDFVWTALCSLQTLCLHNTQLIKIFKEVLVLPYFPLTSLYDSSVALNKENSHQIPQCLQVSSHENHDILFLLCRNSIR